MIVESVGTKDKQLLKFTKIFMMHMNLFKGISLKKIKTDSTNTQLLQLTFKSFDKKTRGYVSKVLKVKYLITLKISKRGVKLVYKLDDDSTRKSKINKFLIGLNHKAKKLQNTIFKNSGRAFEKWVLFPSEYSKFNLNSIER